MLITCRDTDVNKTIIYQDGLSFIQERASVRAKLDKIKSTNNNHRPFGILLFGIDTLSQFNFRRVMPKTFQYVQNHSWFELSGYNKVNKYMFSHVLSIFI